MRAMNEILQVLAILLLSLCSLWKYENKLNQSDGEGSYVRRKLTFVGLYTKYSGLHQYLIAWKPFNVITN